MRERTPSSVYPLFLTNLASIHSVVVGGGAVAARKVRGLLVAGAQVSVISPELCDELDQLRAQGQIGWLARPFAPGDLAHADLVFAATNVRDVNHAVAAEARQRRILCNVADRPEEGSFHVPAVYRHTDVADRPQAEHPATGDQPKSDVVIAVGTSGTEPRRAAQLRDWIATLFQSRSAE
jgi:siroheme synthase (precorrin-2 oxidase/ferrochelatase)